MVRKFTRWAATISLVGIGLVWWAAPASAVPAQACPAHPAQFAGKTVHLSADAGDDALTCANLSGAKLDGLDLIQFNLQYANLTGASLLGADLTQADLTGAQLSGAKFDGANLTQATLSNTVASATSFRHAKLGQATIKNATMLHADFTGADLGQADLTGTDLTNATLTGADFTQATLKGTTMTGAIGKPGSVGGLSLPDLTVWIGPAIVLLLVLIIVPIIVAGRRARGRVRIYPPAAGYAPPAGPAPGYSGGPGFPTPQPAAPPAGFPFPTVPQQPRPTADLSSVVQGDTPAPYIPTVPEFPAWQPMTTTASMTEASHVVEEVKEKRRFRKD